MTVEINAGFERSDGVFASGGCVVMITPPLDENYWVARVVLHKDQAIVCFPKFGTIGCGFAQEEDWNTNLPISCDAEDIYRHIKHNKKYEAITDEMCLEAIRALQAALIPKKVSA